jgi:feruloyl esterase
MPNLGETVAAIASRRKRFAPTHGRDSGRLKPVTGFGFNPGGLKMLAYAPPELAKDAPLVVVLHGCTQSASAYAEGAGWLTLAERFGFAVVAPEQAQANNPQACFNWFEPGQVTRGAGEVASIRAMVAHAVTVFGCDPGKIFVTGLSAGGAMTAALLATYPDVFHAGAVVAGLPYGAASNMQEAFGAMFQGRSRPAREWGDLVRGASPHKGPWPRLSIWHGEADSTVRSGAAEELAKQWSDVHGLSTAPTVAVTPTGRPYFTWRLVTGDPMVEMHLLPGMGHGVPVDPRGEGVGEAGPFLLDVGVSSSLEIARFWGIAEPIPAVAAESHDGLTTAEDAVFEAMEPERVEAARAKPEIAQPEIVEAEIPEPEIVQPGAVVLTPEPAALPRYQAPHHAPPNFSGARMAAKGHRVDVGAVITTALRSAGLMK